jgi:hypothetical protein
MGSARAAPSGFTDRHSAIARGDQFFLKLQCPLSTAGRALLAARWNERFVLAPQRVCAGALVPNLSRFASTLHSARKDGTRIRVASPRRCRSSSTHNGPRSPAHRRHAHDPAYAQPAGLYFLCHNCPPKAATLNKWEVPKRPKAPRLYTPITSLFPMSGEISLFLREYPPLRRVIAAD